MALSNDDIRRLANLSRLSLDDASIEMLRDDLEGIRGLLKQIAEAPTDGVEPLTHPGDMTLRLREDTITATDARDRYQAIAPQTENGLYLVPRVVE